MSNQKPFDFYENLKKMGDQWERQINDSIHLLTNNREFLELMKSGSDFQTPYLKMLKRNQEVWANLFNLPTKHDVANVAKIAIQTEEKVDALEEQLWKLEEKLDQTNKEMSTIAEVSHDIIKLTKQLKAEQKKDQEKVKKIQSSLNEVQKELTQVYSLKEELIELKKLMAEKEDLQEQDRELTVVSK